MRILVAVQNVTAINHENTHENETNKNWSRNMGGVKKCVAVCAYVWANFSCFSLGWVGSKNIIILVKLRKT